MGFERPVATVTTRLRFLFASYPEIMDQVLRIVYRAIVTHLWIAGDSSLNSRTYESVLLLSQFS